MDHAGRVPRHAVDRPSLRSQLEFGSAAPLTLLVAPAGSGKTVLLAQWAESRPSRSVAWVDVSASDDDAAVFARRLLQAVADVDPRFGQPQVTIETAGGGLGESFIEGFAAALSELDELAVVFDDLHHIDGSPILTDLWRLVDRLPPNAHFIFASRIDLQLGWSRHRLLHGLVELRQAQLAFSDDVTASVLERITGVSVSDTTAALVTRHTEGWAAGVQLTALSMRARKHPETFAAHLMDTDRLIIDYLTEEVFSSQSAERQEALLRLSVLDEMCAGLAEDVAGVADGDALLRQFERESMFIVAAPDRVGWYRFHPLFRDLLHFRLLARDADDETRLLRVAAEWHLERADTATAVEYLLRARAWDSVCQIVLASGRDVYERLRTTTIARWLSQIPEEVRSSDPHVELLHGMVVGMSGRGAHAVQIMQRLLSGNAMGIGETQVAATYLAACVYHVPHPDRFLTFAQRSLELLASHPEAIPPDLLNLTSRPFLETVSSVALARARLLLGDILGARAAAEAALSSEGSDYGPYRVQVLGTLAVVEAWAGRLHRASALADAALELARELSLLSHPSPADAQIARAIVAIQRGEPDAGAYSLHEGNIRAAADQRTQLMWIAHLASTLIDPRGTDSAAIEPQGPPPPIVTSGLSALEWRHARLNGAPRDPGRWPEQHWSALAFEHVAALLERGSPSEARSLLERARLAPDDTLPAHTIQHGIAWAWLLAAEGRGAESRVRLVDALELAEREGLVYPVMAAGSLVLTLVKALPGQQSEFRQRLVQATAADAAAERLLPHPLTARELELLAYLPTRLTSSEIAQRWYVSVNTIKTHQAHLYRKLGVTDRDSAVDRAQELGLLKGDPIALRT